MTHLALHATTTSTGFFVLLGLGLLTGLSHCVGMCGPLVSAFAMRRRSEKQEICTPLVFYQMGRLTTYGLLGVTVGSVGSVVAAIVRDWQGAFSVALGIPVMILGFGLLGLFPFQHGVAVVTPARRISQWAKRSLMSHHPVAPFVLGLANGLLPCGPVYAVVLLAVMSGNPLKGAGLMLIFGLGTLPAMLGMGFSASFLGAHLRYQLHRAAAILVVVTGLQLTLRGLALYGQIPHTAIGGIMLW